MGLISRVSSRTYRFKMVSRRPWPCLVNILPILCYAVSVIADEINDEDANADNKCSDLLGFNSLTLMCSTCKEMDEFSLSDKLKAACNDCCNGVEVEPVEKYNKVEIHVCN